MNAIYFITAGLALVALYLTVRSELAQPRRQRRWWPVAALLTFALLAVVLGLWHI